MKTEFEIYAALTDIFRELFGQDEIILSAETTADHIEGWDSFNHMNIILATEVRFGIRLEFSEMEDVKSVGALVSLVLRKSSGG